MANSGSGATDRFSSSAGLLAILRSQANLRFAKRYFCSRYSDSSFFAYLILAAFPQNREVDRHVAILVKGPFVDAVAHSLQESALDIFQRTQTQIAQAYAGAVVRVFFCENGVIVVFRDRLF